MTENVDEIIVEEVEKTQKERLGELSQELFGKPVKDIKYLLVTNYIHQQLLDEELTRTGLYQWLNVFNGTIKYPRDVEDYNDYDIVQVNMSTQDLHLVNDIKEQLTEGSKTKVVLNNDFTTELWGNAFNSPSTLAREGKNADMIFGTEYYQVTALSELFGRQVFIIPHPADVKRLKALPEMPKKELISTVWRRYDNFSYVPSLAVRNHGLTTQLIGFDKDKDPKTWVTTTLYDVVFAATNYFDYWDQMRESKIVYDPFTFHSYNRGVVDCAAMGVPVVGSNRTQSVNVCYPFTKVDPYDVVAARKLINRLLNDEAFYDKVVKHAQETVEIYNHQNSMEKYFTALTESKQKEDKKVVKKAPVVEKSRGDEVNTLIAKGITREK